MRISGALGTRAVIGAFLLAAAGWGCSEDQTTGCAQKVVTSEQSCSIASDCEGAGLDLRCVDGRCRLPCRADSDCDLVANADPNDDPECRADPNTTPAAVCEAGVCEIGCPDQPCEAGESCFEGRCVLYGEGFEIPDGAPGVDLRLLGFNDPPGELANSRTKIVWSGPAGCDPAQDLNCNGAAGQGERFVLLESEPTLVKGTALTETTCRACACCLECLADPPATPVSLNACPLTADIPAPVACEADAANCTAVCNACAACPAANRPGVASNPLLASCEKTAAARRCALCDDCDALLETCRATECPPCAESLTSAACRDCVDANCLQDQRCQDCRTCAEAQNCRRNNDLNRPDCNTIKDTCDQQGADGCFEVPVDYLRAQLSDAEQAIASPAVDLSGVEGRVILELDYVSFNVGVSYFPGIQGVPPDMWSEATQSVRIQLCEVSTCGPADWLDATLVRGGRAVLPPDSERDNGRLLGTQTVVDWRRGRVQVDIPSAVRTSTFRYRLLPELDLGAQLAVDNILIRRVP